MKNKDKYLVTSLISLALFLLLAILTNTGFFYNLDGQISNLFNETYSSFINQLSVFLGVLFEPIYIFLLFLAVSLVLWIKKYRKESLFLIFLAGLSGISIKVFKIFFSRARPLVAIISETGYSFPSGHATISVILFGSLIYLYSLFRKNKINLVVTSTIGVILIGASRIYLNVHWITDVIGGYFLGSSILFLGMFIYESNIFQRLANLLSPK